MRRERDPKQSSGYPFSSTGMGQGSGAGAMSLEQTVAAQGALLQRLEAMIRQMMTQGVPVELPRHLFAPRDSQTIDVRRVESVLSGTQSTLVDFVAPGGGGTYVTHYALFNDGLLATDFDYFIRVDGKQVYPYQGDSILSFRKYLGLAPDLSNNSLIPGYLSLQPGQRLTIVADNRSAVDTVMGARVQGYFDANMNRQGNFGG